jgi:hypothetical protein
MGDDERIGGRHFSIDIKARKVLNVATLALGSRPRQRGYKVTNQKEAPESRQEEARDSR